MAASTGIVIFLAYYDTRTRGQSERGRDGQGHLGEYPKKVQATAETPEYCREQEQGL